MIPLISTDHNYLMSVTVCSLTRATSVLYPPLLVTNTRCAKSSLHRDVIWDRSSLAGLSPGKMFWGSKKGGLIVTLYYKQPTSDPGQSLDNLVLAILARHDNIAEVHSLLLKLLLRLFHSLGMIHVELFDILPDNLLKKRAILQNRFSNHSTF